MTPEAREQPISSFDHFIFSLLVRQPSLSPFFPFLQVASGMKISVKAIWFMFNER